MQIYKLSDLSKVLSTPVSTLRRWAKEGYIPAFKLAKIWYVEEDELQMWLKDQKERGAVTPLSYDSDMLSNLTTETEVD